MSEQPLARTISPKTELEAFALLSSIEQAKGLHSAAQPYLERARACLSQAIKLVLSAQGIELTEGETATVGEVDGQPVILINGSPIPVDLQPETEPVDEPALTEA